jgi:hypothetical protein
MSLEFEWEPDKAAKKAGTNLVLLAPDVAEAFPDEQAVNNALRLVNNTLHGTTKF